MGKLKFNRIIPVLTSEEIDCIENGTADVELEAGDLTYDKIVSEFKSTGKYYDIDYPGGILQLVKDYESGKLQNL